MPKDGKRESGDDETSDDGVLFYVNKSGFPIDEPTWDRMWNYVAKLHPSSYKMVHKIRGNKSLPEILVSQPPVNFPSNTTVDEKICAMQSYMSGLQYNHTGTQFYEIKKNRPITGLLDTAKEMIRESLPIKCLEAVILATHLTNGIAYLDRFPISFKTVFGGRVFRHVVLGIYHNGRYGALGMSRRQELMYKPLTFKSLTSLMMEYKKAYEKYWHDVKKMKVGMPIPHDAHSYETINWKKVSLTVGRMKEEDMSKEIERHAREMRTQTKKRTELYALYTPYVKTKPALPPEATSPLRKSSFSPDLKPIATKGRPKKPKSGTPAKRKRLAVKQSPVTISMLRHSDEEDEDSGGRPNMASLGGYQIRV